ncbi:DMT family transporter [Metalysinibacillus jejuensis]|uniref:DMT family transporter n=1 Tax=Metalysinibacillus jejuensis TaxID=914327 RepID=UPI000D3D460F|nr:DMT family transporter [Metalysinibacillus jejuensis]
MRFHPIILLLLATLLWGGNFVIGRAVSDQIAPFSLAFLRWCTAFIIFFPIAYPHVKKHWRALWQYRFIVLLMAFTGVAAFNTLVYIGLHYTTSINASLMNSSTPIMIYILSFLLLREKLSLQQLIGTLLSLSGVAFIIAKGQFASLLSFQFNKGDMIVLVAVMCWSLYSLLVKKYATVLHGQATFLVTIALGILMLLPFFIYEVVTRPDAIIWNMGTISAIGYVGVFASIVAFLSWNTGVIKIGANRAGIFLNFIPVFASIFAVIFLNEQLALYQLLGGFAVILGVLLCNYQRKNQRSA